MNKVKALKAIRPKGTNRGSLHSFLSNERLCNQNLQDGASGVDSSQDGSPYKMPRKADQLMLKVVDNTAEAEI
jgi:hypothetical protein